MISFWIGFVVGLFVGVVLMCLMAIQKKEEGGKSSLDVKKASKEELFAYLSEVLPAFDRDRVHPSDVKKLIQWYNILIENGLTDFDEALKETEGNNIDDRKE